MPDPTEPAPLPDGPAWWLALPSVLRHAITYVAAVGVPGNVSTSPVIAGH